MKRLDPAHVTVFGDDLELELFAADERKGLLEMAFGTDVHIASKPA